MKNQIKEKKGITLIALVITIIVLLILAGVTIATLTGDNGLLTKAGNAKNAASDAEIEEKLKLTAQEYKMGQYIGENSDLYNFMQGKLEELYGKNNYNLTRMGKNIKIEIVGKNRYYILKYDGSLNGYDKVEKIAATDEMYGYLDEENQILYLRATPKTNYTALTKQLPEKSYVIKNNFDASKIEIIDIEEAVAPLSGYFMFISCNKLERIEHIENLHTENMNSTMGMFEGCRALSSINLSGFDTSKVTVMNYMFCGCSKLQNLNFEVFDTRKVSNMRTMFQGCGSLKSLDLSSFDTSMVTIMPDMFYGCSSLKKIDVSSFDTIKCTNFYIMFSQCKELEELDISNFNLNSTANINQMFNGCSKLKRLNLGSNFVITDGNNTNQILNGVPSDIKIKATRATKDKIVEQYPNLINNFELFD